MARRRKKDLLASLKGIFAIMATILGFLAALVILVIVERLVFG